MDLGKIFLLALLVNNIVVMRFLALCSYIGMTNDVGQSIGMGFAVTFVTVLATAATWPIYHYILVPLDLTFLQILIFILVIASLVQSCRILTSKRMFRACTLPWAFICRSLRRTALSLRSPSRTFPSNTTSFSRSYIRWAYRWATFWRWYCSRGSESA